MKPLDQKPSRALVSILFVLLQACSTLVPVPTTSPSPVPEETRVPLSQLVTLSSISFKEEGGWWVDVPPSTYNQKDKAKAKRLLQEAGYKGQPIRYMTTQEYDFLYKFALVARQQLEEVGMKVDLQVVDTPPSARGNTAQGSNKPATLETGLIVQVPFFVNTGETIRVDTRTGSYLERVS